MFKFPWFSRKPKTPEVTPPSTQEINKITSVIAKSAEFHGDLKLAEGIKIDGLVRGNVTIDGDGLLIVSEGAVVEGDVNARTAIISGRIAGHARIARLILQPSATIDGELSYSMVKMAEGATVTGSMNRTPNPSQFMGPNVTPIMSAVASS
jgi:cytoskeletal protein CcmA (bactofilin family)